MATITFDEFVKQHLGKGMDYDNAAGVQCVDLAKYYLDEVFEIKAGAWGDAHCYYDNFNNITALKNNFTRIAYTSGFVPKKGDIAVWKSSLSSGGWGHIAICDGVGDKSYFYSYDQNWTGKHDPCTRIKHNYNQFAGVLRPKDQSKITTVNNNTVKTTSVQKKIIDISYAQSNVDYAKLAKECDGVIIRIGYRGYSNTGSLVKDNMFDKHIAGIVKNKIPFGFYFFSQAINAAEGKAEADFAYNIIKSYKPTYPVYFDSEMSTDSNGNGRADKISKSNRTAAAVAFCKQIQAKGLLAGVYASESWFTNYLDFSQIKTYSIWVAKYGTNTGKAQIKPTTSVYDGWQFSSSYKISAISTNVDVSYFYKDFGNTGNTNTNNTSTNSSTNLFIVGKTYTLTVDVKVRASAGITSRWKKRSELSTDGKKNSLNQTNAVLKKGTKITVLKITKKSDKEYWAQIPSGWVALMYNGTKYIK